jgi:hypothetical protein
MKFILIALHEIAYMKDNRGDIVRKYYAPAGRFFYPGLWEFEEFPKDFSLKTLKCESLKDILNRSED